MDESRVAAEIRAQCARSRSICPSQVARALQPDGAGWRALMPQVRAVAAWLATTGEIVVTQRGVEVDAVGARGPIRLRRSDR
ncbi:MAG: DUF3253 domain-containing protein [Planctomycetes bacterium]|nr:DUF3253 domain-containing protein [Planctomycetota bacterium]